MRPRSLCLVLVVSLGSACSSKGTGEGAYATEPRVVTLVQPGAEPRRALAYAFSQPRREAAVSLDVGTPEMSSISLRGTLVWARTKQAADRVDHAFRFRDVTGRRDPTMGDSEWSVVKGIYSGFEAVTGIAHVARGGAVTFEQTGGLPTTPSWLAMLHVALTPFPTEAVGTGARWRSQQPIKSADGTPGIDEREYELVSIDGDRLELRVTGRTTYQPASGTESNQDLKLVEATLALSGDLELTLDDALPRSAAFELRPHLRFEPSHAMPESVGLVRFAIGR